MLEERLLQIGVGKTEAKTYLEMLKIGPQPASIIAKRIGVNRTTTYSALRALEKKGMVGSYTSANVKCYLANDPNCLIAFLDRKCRTFDYYRCEILSAIPKFRELSGGYDFKKPVVSYFDGVEGVKHVMSDSLNCAGSFYSYLALQKWFSCSMHDFIVGYRNECFMQKPFKAIVPDTEEVRAFFKCHYLDDGMKEILYVEDRSDFGIFENEMNIYDNKVAIVHLETGEEYGVVIESKEIAEMQRNIFKMAWNGISSRQKNKTG